ncbi:Nicotinic acid mononucleotide adenylyltransferase [Alkalithermobacter thermoalcaliphilus JW-YL-7 = DSM 7308]|uniref:nicotinate-nucleotide adenylyltransferase n=1 Tax=Alkalithermobacter thermoalcaliphilus JW-YL-7 = DSM 7308 TaxID=1121328 RepID=A0A150FRM0_CLOPD|nr:cytidylyltransferase [[Clostridium] paradoxum JW-YL-7 = DSM 7308]SHK41455.1 Nicotinic acid mononucleotide adenylyltransferase [[Clostridium] paradoxum JW-YL-7 = DSM 7308]
MISSVSTQIHNTILSSLLNDNFLDYFSLDKTMLTDHLNDSDFINKIDCIIIEKDYSCSKVLSLCIDLLNKIHKDISFDQWLTFIYNVALSKSFPSALSLNLDNIPKSLYAACHVYLNILKIFCEFEKISDSPSWQSKYPLNFLTFEEESSLEDISEYRVFKRAFEDEYIYEMMKLNQEVLGHNTLDHICGVHSLALFISRQLKQLNVPIDLARVSGACAGHDIGKFGCKSCESSRVAYLHYYYTDQWFKRHNITYIGHIALNHSVWDLELENLSLESLILIYCDFRVKNKKDKDNKFKMHIFSLDEAFDVILNKLDNVDSEKEKRYKKVYSKLKDFEDYMISIGVNVDINENINIKPKNKSYYPLMHGDDIIKNIKYMSIKHNINLMYKLRNEASLNSILEMARSSKYKKNLREYLQAFNEYCTYLTQNQKLIMLKFLYEQLINHEDDIRRDCSELIGTIISIFDEDYRKEIPKDETIDTQIITSFELLDYYLDLFINPDHKIIPLHQKWIGYNLSNMIGSLFSNCKKDQIGGYISVISKYYENGLYKNPSTQLYLLNCIKHIPIQYDETFKNIFLDYILNMIKHKNDNLRLTALYTAYTLLYKVDKNSEFIENLKNTLISKQKSHIYSEDFITSKILNSIYLKNNTNFFIDNSREISKLYLNNLKTSTPWIIKKINIDLLLESALKNKINMTYTAIHFSNLLKVSGVEGVRNSAGMALIKLMPYLSLEQRNDIAIELLRSLEIEGYQFSKYIPHYLGQVILYLQPSDLDELIDDIKFKVKRSQSTLNFLLLKTVGVAIRHYFHYKNRFSEKQKSYKERLNKLLGILLNGLANYSNDIKQFSFKVISKDIFGCNNLDIENKKVIFGLIAKKMLTLLASDNENYADFLSISVGLNNIYRFICDIDSIKLDIPEKVAFFPGTFDPFSLSHKEIAKNIESLGFEVYLAVDEFSWSKKTQPNMFRRNLINMSVADELNIYIYPEDFPINIANPKDLEKLKDTFSDYKLYIVVGSDVILNASAYKRQICPNSIHNFNHIIFERRNSDSPDDFDDKFNVALKNIKGDVLTLNLKPQYEDISSSQIRDYIDKNRDISDLIDPLAQNYIYEKGLYQKEARYKDLMEVTSLEIQILDFIDDDLIYILCEKFLKNMTYMKKIKNFLQNKNSKVLLITENDDILGFCLFKEEDSYQNKKTVVMNGIFSIDNFYSDLNQIILTETLCFCVENEFEFAFYKNEINQNLNTEIEEILRLYGFYKLEKDNEFLFGVDMTNPCILNLDVESFIKSPFKTNTNVRTVINNSRKKLQKSIASLYPGNLLLSFDLNILNKKLVKKICMENNVPSYPTNPKTLGEYICVPFGNVLNKTVIPNTVTKSLHTEKLFSPDTKNFWIEAFPYYLSLENQVKTVASFDRPVILVDDILNKGYRINALDPILKNQNINVKKIIVGILSKKGKDLMIKQNRDVDSVYYIPNLRVWFNENVMYPFIGGDTLWRGFYPSRNLIPSINLILPYTTPYFIKNATAKSLYTLSKTCLENSIDILSSIENEYLNINNRTLTLNNLGEVFIYPRYPDIGKDINYNLNLNPSYYLKEHLQLLNRMEDIINMI